MTINPFLVLGVSFDAEVSDLQRVAKMRLMEMSLDGNENSPEARQIDKALDEVRDPVKRYEHGLMALTLTPEESLQIRDDAVLSSLAQGVTPSAIDRFDQLMVKDANGFDWRSNMNLGVLKYYRAKQATHDAQQDTPDDASDDLALVPIWCDAFEHLRQGLDSQEYWGTRKLHAKCIDDPRLTDAISEEINERLWQKILDPLGGIIATALEQMHTSVAKDFVEVVRRSGAPGTVTDQVLSMVYKPTCDEIERHIDALEESLNGFEIKSGKVAEAKKIFNDFKARCLPQLNMILSVGDLPGYAEEHARDRSASFLRSLAIDVANNGDDYLFSQQILAEARKFVDSDALSDKLEGDASDLKDLIRQAEENKGASACAFCGEENAQPNYEVDMHKVVSRGFGSVQYKSGTIKIPRCDRCKDGHDAISKAGWSAAAILFLTICGMVIANEPDAWWASPIVGGVVTFIAAGIVGAIHEPFRRYKLNKHPIIRHMRSQGFSHGAQPSGTR